MSYKQETRDAYNKLASEFSQKFKEHAGNFLGGHIQAFMDALPPCGKIVDLGCGPGIHAAEFQRNDFEVLCVDFSEEMVKICQEKGLNAVVGDFEEIDFVPGSVDGFWAYTSLLHTTREKLPEILAKINSWLKPGGYFGLSMKQGVGEGFKVSDKDGTSKRWFTYYRAHELSELLRAAGFDNRGSYSADNNGEVFLNYLLRKSQPQTGV